jgi:hypothetical protein
VSLSLVDRINKTMISRIASITCDGAKVSSVANCVDDGTVCSDQGTCLSGSCVCNSGYEGDYCQTTVRPNRATRIVSHIPHFSFLAPV